MLRLFQYVMTEKEIPTMYEEMETPRHGTGDQLGVLAVQNEVKIETEPSIPEISTERQATYSRKDPNIEYLILCGDDRNVTAESIAALKEQGFEKPENSIRYFGGEVGIMRVFALAVAVQYGEEVLARYSKDPVQLTDDVNTRVEATNNVRGGIHSAEANEENPAQINEHSEKGVGCAYCASFGGVCSICAHNEAAAELAKSEQSKLFKDNSLVEPVIEANRKLEDHLFDGNGADRGLGRSDFAKLGAPVAILEGPHGASEDLVVVQNFTDKVSDPGMANESGIRFYDNDVTQVAEMLMRAFPELKLKPRILFAVMDHDIRGVRVALASHDGEADASRLALERYGDPEAAIAYLESLDI